MKNIFFTSKNTNYSLIYHTTMKVTPWKRLMLSYILHTKCKKVEKLRIEFINWRGETCKFHHHHIWILFRQMKLEFFCCLTLIVTCLMDNSYYLCYVYFLYHYLREKVLNWTSIITFSLHSDRNYILKINLQKNYSEKWTNESLLDVYFEQNFFLKV